MGTVGECGACLSVSLLNRKCGRRGISWSRCQTSNRIPKYSIPFKPCESRCEPTKKGLLHLLFYVSSSMRPPHALFKPGTSVHNSFRNKTQDHPPRSSKPKDQIPRSSKPKHHPPDQANRSTISPDQASRDTIPKNKTNRNPIPLSKKNQTTPQPSPKSP